MTNDQRQLMIGQLRCGKTGDQIMSILDSIVADYMPELKYNDTVVPAKYAPASWPIEFWYTMPKYDSQYYSVYQTTRPNRFIMDRLTMLTQREQLMEDIDCIITEYFKDTDIYDVNYDHELVMLLCDAVCKNFPVNW